MGFGKAYEGQGSFAEIFGEPGERPTASRREQQRLEALASYRRRRASAYIAALDDLDADVVAEAVHELVLDAGGEPPSIERVRQHIEAPGGAGGSRPAQL